MIKIVVHFLFYLGFLLQKLAHLLDQDKSFAIGYAYCKKQDAVYIAFMPFTYKNIAISTKISWKKWNKWVVAAAIDKYGKYEAPYEINETDR